MHSTPNSSQKMNTTPTKLVDGQIVDNAVGGNYDVELYQCDPIANSIESFETLSDQDIEHYRQQGYLVIRNAFSLDRIQNAKDALMDLIDAQSEESIYIQFEAWAIKNLGRMTPEQKALAVRKFMNFSDLDPRLTAIARDQQMLALLGRIMHGKTPDILQDMSLLKPPGGREKPWHQDRAYFDVHTDIPIVGTWIALDSATPENGCMRLWPGRHREGPLLHFQRRDWQICDTEIHGQQRVSVPLEPGGLLLFDGLVPHGTPSNETAEKRWALQFHYCPVGVSTMESEYRTGIFGSEGKDVEC